MSLPRSHFKIVASYYRPACAGGFALQVLNTIALRKLATLASVGVVVTLLCYVAFRDRSVQISFQGEQYIKGAWSLQENGDFGPTRRDLARYGPLYSILLAGPKNLGYSPGHAVVLVNAVVLSASFVVFYVVAGLLDARPPWIATIFYATLASNMYFFRMARPDAIVPLMAMLTVWGVVHYSTTGKRGYLLFVALTCGLGATARYMGLLTVIPLAATGLWLWGPRRRRARLLDLLIFGTIACAPMTTWMIRNRDLTGHFTGMARTAATGPATGNGLAQSAMGIAKTVWLDLFGVRAMGTRQLIYDGVALPYAKATLVLSIVGAGLILTIALLACTRILADPGPVPRAPVRRARFLVGAYAVAHLLVLLGVWTWSSNDPVHTRFVAPVYWCLVLAGFSLSGISDASRRSKLLLVGSVLLGVLVAGTNVDKTVLLLRDVPSEHLMNTRVRDPFYRGIWHELWVRPTSWEHPWERSGRASGAGPPRLREPPKREDAPTPSRGTGDRGRPSPESR